MSPVSRAVCIWSMPCLFLPPLFCLLEQKTGVYKMYTPVFLCLVHFKGIGNNPRAPVAPAPSFCSNSVFLSHRGSLRSPLKTVGKNLGQRPGAESNAPWAKGNGLRPRGRGKRPSDGVSQKRDGLRPATAYGRKSKNPAQQCWRGRGLG